MKILVTAKRVTDPDTTLTLKRDGGGPDLDDVDYKMNPFCEIAVEEGLKIIEELGEGEVVVAAIGADAATKEIRTGLAMGGDRGILVECEEEELDSDLVAQILKALVDKEEPDLVILGKQATDGDSNQVGQLLAEYLGWPQATFAYKITINDDGPDILETKRDEVFRPFYRIDHSRDPETGGTVLGLSTARDVVRAHGGEIVLGASPLGGLRATVRLPL